MLDINTARGQVSLFHEQKIINLLIKKYGANIIQTPKHLDAVCDGMVINPDGCINSIYEFKCRDNLIQKDDGIYYQSGTYSQKEDSWLITHNKILECVDVASKLKVPFIGWLYLINSNIVYQFNITDSHGKYLFEFDVKNTKTQKTINGGTINRNNAFLPFKYSHQILVPSDFM